MDAQRRWATIRSRTVDITSILSRDSSALAVIIAAGVLYIVSNARFGLIDPQTWRQADVYAHILGFFGLGGVPVLTTFDGNRVMYDVPVYQVAIAALSRVTRVDPLIVTRFVNAVIWAVFVWTAYKIAETLRRGSGLIAAGLITISPLMLHYWSVPLPDVLALTLAMVGLLKALETRFGAAALAFGLAALIKSPIPFVVLIALAILALATGKLRRDLGGYLRVSAGALAGAACAEILRRLVTPPTSETDEAFSPSWYFGTLGQRRSTEFWERFADRLTEVFPGAAAGAVILLVVAVALLVRWRTVWPSVLAGATAYLAGWLVFSELYFFHSYYALAAAAVLLVGAAVASSALFGNSRWIALALVVLVPVGLVYGPKLSPREVATFYDAARFAFREQDAFVLVEDTESGPAWGGLTGKPMVRLRSAEFQQRCEEVFAQYRAFVTYSLGPSCLDQHQDQLSVLISVPDGTAVWVFHD